MVFCIVDQTIIREDDPLGTPAFCTQSINVALGVIPVFRQQTFVVAELVTADTHSGGIGFQRAAFPSQLPGF